MKRALRSLFEVLLRPLRWVLYHLVRWVSIRSVVKGVEIIDYLAVAEESARIRKVAGALELLAEYDPVVLRRLQNYLRAVIINDTRTGYLRPLKVCVLNSSLIESRGEDAIALALAHEVTHAVLHQAGFRYEPKRRERIEHACVRAEIRLARKLPNGERLLERTKAKFHQEWWTDEDLRAGREAELRQMGMPEWVIRLRRVLRG